MEGRIIKARKKFNANNSQRKLEIKFFFFAFSFFFAPRIINWREKIVISFDFFFFFNIWGVCIWKRKNSFQSLIRSPFARENFYLTEKIFHCPSCASVKKKKNIGPFKFALWSFIRGVCVCVPWLCQYKKVCKTHAIYVYIYIVDSSTPLSVQSHQSFLFFVVVTYIYSPKINIHIYVPISKNKKFFPSFSR